MATTLELPEKLDAPVTAIQANKTAEQAASLLDGDGTAQQRIEEITIRLVRDVEDPVNGFSAVKDQVFSAYVDSDGSTWIPFASISGKSVDICVEAEEFEVVLQLAETAEPKIKTTQPEAGGCAAPSDQQAGSALPPAEPATPSVASDATEIAVDEKATAVANWNLVLGVLEKEMAKNQLAIAVDEQDIARLKKDISEREEKHGEILAEYQRTCESGPSIRVSSTRRPTMQIDGGKPVEIDSVTFNVTADVAVTDMRNNAVDQQTERDYETLLRSAKMADLVLKRDGKKVSLKGSVEKLAEAGVVTIWDWENLQKQVGLHKAEFPKRLRFDDLKDAVCEWVAKQQLPKPATVVAPDDQATVAVPVEQQQQARDSRVTTILESQSINALADVASTVEIAAMLESGITTLAKLERAIDDKSLPTAVPMTDIQRAFRTWKSENMNRLIDESMDRERAEQVKEASPDSVASEQPPALPANVVTDLDEL